MNIFRIMRKKRLKKNNVLFGIILVGTLTLFLLFFFPGSSSKSEQRIIHPRHPFEDLSPANYSTIPFVGSNKTNCMQTTDILVVILSAVPNRMRRDYVRQSLGSFGNSNLLTYRLLFVLGMPKEKEKLRDAIHESKLYDDVLIVGIDDNYRNLTFKTLGWLRWTSDNCHNFRYILKIDDDTIVRMQPFIKLVAECEKEKDDSRAAMCRRSLSCNVWTDAMPLRTSKNLVRYEEYSAASFPHMCPGVAYFIPKQLLPKLWAAAQHVKFLWLEDVFLTGLVREYANLTLFPLNQYYMKKNEEGKMEWQTMASENKLFGHLVADDPYEYYQIWCTVNQPHYKCPLFDNAT